MVFTFGYNEQLYFPIIFLFNCILSLLFFVTVIQDSSVVVDGFWPLDTGPETSSSSRTRYLSGPGVTQW